MVEIGISIVVTTYGRVNRIEKCLESIIELEYNNYEVIVVDDNGKNTENQKSIEKKIKKYRKKLGENLKYIINDFNLGANGSRNIGIKNSKNEYIAFLDDDDEYMKDRFLEVNSTLEKNKYDLIYTGAIMYNEKKQKEKYRFFRAEEEKIALKKQILLENFIGSNSFVIVKKSKIIEVGGYDEKLKAGQDWDLWIRIIMNDGSVLGIDKPLVKYYINLDPTRISNNLDRLKEALEIIFRKINDNFLKEFDIEFRDKIIFIQKKFFMEYYYKKNEFKKFRNVFKELTYNFKNKRIGNKNKLRYYLSYFKIKI